MSLSCAACGTINESDAAFCKRCGVAQTTDDSTPDGHEEPEGGGSGTRRAGIRQGGIVLKLITALSTLMVVVDLYFALAKDQWGVALFARSTALLFLVYFLWQGKAWARWTLASLFFLSGFVLLGAALLRGAGGGLIAEEAAPTELLLLGVLATICVLGGIAVVVYARVSERPA